MKHILYSILFAFCYLSANAQVVIDQRVDTMQILIGEQTKLTLSATVNEGQKVKFPEFAHSQNIVPGLEVLDSRQDTLETDNDKLTISKSYVLTSFDEKLYCIPSQNILVDGKAYKTKSLALKVLTVPVDTVHADKFYPPKDVQDNPFSWAEWSGVFYCSLLFVVLLALSLYLLYRIKHNKPIVNVVRIVKHVPPHQKAIKDIEKLKIEQATVSENQKEYYTRLTLILRQYIAERFHFDAMEMTSSQIIDRLRAEGNDAISEISNLFRTADLVKFAKHSALINENDANLMSALSFVNDTKLEEKPQLKVVTPEERKNKEENNRRLLQKLVAGVTVLLALSSLLYVVYRLYVLI